MAAFLGLEQTIANATFQQLREDRYTVEGGDSDIVTLSERGRKTLSAAQEASPQDEMLVFLYDRLLRRPVRLTAEQLVAPVNVDLTKMIEIRAYPAEGPTVSELSKPDVSLVLQQQSGGKGAFGRDVLRLKRIVRRVRLFRPAVALVFKKRKSPEVLVEFFVDDARHEDLSHAFAERGGPKKMGFLKAIDESVTAAKLRRYLGSEVQKLLPDPKALEKELVAVSMARMKLQIAKAKDERQGGVAVEAGLHSDAVAEALNRVHDAEEGLRRFPARAISVFELPELIVRAMQGARSKLWFTSKGVDSSVIDGPFFNTIEQALQRSVAIEITINGDAGRLRDGKVAAELEKLRIRHQNLTLSTEKEGDFYHLICDDTFAVVTNRSLLGNAERVRTFQHVVGYLLQRRDLVGAFAARATKALPTPGN